jgi:uncharacterized protein YndB with AHSA1/START domain
MSTTIAAIRKTIRVDANPEHAFRVFTEGIGRWWPLERHSIHEQDAETVVLEAREGGRLYERSRSGTEAVWGEILECDPPRLLRYTWHPGYEDGAPGTEIEVRFEPDGDGTRVDFEHRGWERLGDAAPEQQRGYDEGWDYVLARYVDATSS